ncbi:hypothetical protein vseg_015100 [Gypsophila vaccaria]
MSTPEVDHAQALLLEDDVEGRYGRQGMEGDANSTDIEQVANNFKQLKSFEIIKSSLRIFTSNTKLMFLMMFSVIPFFVFLVFYEIKLQKIMAAAPGVPMYPHRSIHVVVSVSSGYLRNGSRSFGRFTEIPQDDDRMEFVSEFIQICIFFLVLYPLLELLSMITTVQIAAKLYAGEKPAALKDVFYQKNNLKGVLVTCGYVHLLSCLTLLGLIWIVANHLVFGKFGSSWGTFWQPEAGIGQVWYILLLGIHTMMFVALLYKYLHWSSFWNMSMVISVLEEETGLDAFGMTGYYGKHCRPTGFQLMLGFVGFAVVLRLPYLYGGLSNHGVGFTSVIIGSICLESLVKWIAFVLYYFDCKQQTMEKKNDEEIRKTVNMAIVCVVLGIWDMIWLGNIISTSFHSSNE